MLLAGGRLGRRHAPPTGRSVSPRRRAAPVGAVLICALEAFECRSNERADRLEHVAALLHEDGRELERAEAAPRFPIAVGSDGERRVGIVRGGIDAERDDERLAPMRRARPRQGGRHRRARRRRSTRVRAGRSDSPLRPRRRTRGSAGTIPRRIDVHRRREDVAAVPEDRLRAVSVVGIDVEERDAPDTVVAKILRRDRRVVQIARAAERRTRDVVAGRSAARVGSSAPLSTRSAAVSAASTAARAASHVPCATTVIVSKHHAPVRAESAVGTRAAIPPRRPAWGRCSPRRRSVPGRQEPGLGPVLPRRPEELDEPGIVDREDRLV